MLRKFFRFLCRGFAVVADPVWLGGLLCLAGVSFLPLTGLLAQQTININGPIDYYVYGNGEQPNGYAPNPVDPETLVNSPHNNNVNVIRTGATVAIDVSGAYGISANDTGVTGNQVVISGGAIFGIVQGAESRGSGDVADNHVQISDIINSYVDMVYGGRIFSNGGGDVINNSVTLVNVGAGGVRGIDGVLNNVSGGNVNSFAGAGSALKNKVTISNSIVNREVSGGFVSNDGDASENIVIISDSEIGADVKGGYMNLRSPGEASDNRVTISNSTVGTKEGSVFDGGSVFGGVGHNAYRNNVNISDSTLYYSVTGGAALNNCIAAYNNVSISNCRVDGEVIGGFGNDLSDTATVLGNSVTIGNNSNIIGNVLGGHAESVDGEVTVTGNSMTVSDSTLGNRVYGGDAQSTNGNVTATGNSVNISQSSVGDLIFGVFAGSTNGDATAAGNTVHLTDTTVGTSIYGGEVFSKAGDATTAGNSISIFDSTVGGKIHGGYAECNGYGSATATGNAVNLSGTTADAEVYGGNVYNWYGSATVIGNNVSLIGATAGADVYGGNVFNWYGTAIASDNEIAISDSTIVGSIYGGKAANDTGGNGPAKVTGNIVSITGSTAGANVYGGYAYNFNGKAAVMDNNVTITESTVNGDAAGGYNFNGEASNNSISITGGKITGNIYGGKNDWFGDAINNTVTIRGIPDVSASDIYGGTNRSGDAVTGNTFNLYSAVKTGGVTNTVTAKGLYNFENLNFYMPDPTKNLDILLDVTEKAMITDANVGVAFTGGSTPLREGDHVVLINAPQAADLIGEPANNKAIAPLGVTLIYEFDVYVPDGTYANQLWAELPVGGIRVNPKAEVMSKGFLTGASLLNQAADLVDWHGMNAAANAVANVARQTKRGKIGAFYDMSGGRSRYDTGCTVDLTSLSLIAGLTQNTEQRIGRLTTAAFLEYGNGEYDTLKLFDVEALRCRGNAHYLGCGVLGRLNFTKLGEGRFYTEGSLRGGSIDNNDVSHDLRDVWGNEAGYHSVTQYFAMHAGLGMMGHRSNGRFYNIYGKFFWTHLAGDSVTLTTGDPIDFAAIDSLRLRIGGRSVVRASQTVHTYMGVAWEHEFDGVAHAATYRYAHAAPSLMGGTGLCEAGLSWKPAALRDAYVDFGVQSAIGKREGITATLLVGRNF